MTRENKLALVVGFGLILLVGILISDHFSTARSQETADLRQGRPADPLTQSRRNDPRLIDLRSEQERAEASRSASTPLNSRNPEPRNPVLMNNTHRTLEDVTIPAEERVATEAHRVIIGGSNLIGFDELPEDRRSGNSNAGTVFHNVQRGESMSNIAHRYYGDRSLAADLAKFNGLSDPDTVRVDHRLRIPPLAQLRPGATPTPASGTGSPQAPTRPAEPAARAQTYTIQPGDSLSEIAQRLLGTSRRWREIYELNKDVIRDPDNVPAGIVIKIPR